MELQKGDKVTLNKEIDDIPAGTPATVLRKLSAADAKAAGYSSGEDAFEIKTKAGYRMTVSKDELNLKEDAGLLRGRDLIRMVADGGSPGMLVEGLIHEGKGWKPYTKGLWDPEAAANKMPRGSLDPFLSIGTVEFQPGDVVVRVTTPKYTAEMSIFDQGSKAFGLDDSRISKLWVYKKGESDKRNSLAAYDRGWDKEPEDKEVKALVDTLVKAANDKKFWEKPDESLGRFGTHQ